MIPLTNYEYPPEFIGDGRYRVTPTIHMIQCRGIAVTRSAARQAINRFIATGRSNHSALGGTTWVIARFCIHNKIEYKWNLLPGFGSEMVAVKALAK